MHDQVSVADMMAAREARYMMQQTLLARYDGAVLVCLTMNIAGPVKNTANIRRAFGWGRERIASVLAAHPVVFDAAIDEKTGPEAVFAVRADALEIKRRLCALEDNWPMGRLLDIDVIAGNGEKVSRADVGKPPRRCLLCGGEAAACARSRTHSAKELFDRANAIIDAHFEEEFVRLAARQAQRALLTEAAITPKPGLVDRANAGAHSDMDIFTFIDSACSLGDYFAACAQEGLAHRGGDAAACFDSLRVHGLMAERAMAQATGGVNTHKGAIFSLGIYCAALGMGYGQAQTAEDVLLRCGQMTRAQMEKELDAIAVGEARTFGAQLYKKRGVGGVRAEAAQGYPQVRQRGLPMLRAGLAAGLSFNDAGVCTLIALMGGTQDTNAVRRGGEEAAERLRMEAGRMSGEMEQMLAGGTMQSGMGQILARLGMWDAQMTAARISPGGCADLLALTLLAHFMEERQ